MPISSYPVRVEADHPETSSRLLAVCGILFFLPKLLLLLPHIIIFWFLSIVMLFAAWVGCWAVLFTGSQPRGLFDFIVGCTRWQTRMNAWYFGLTDRYPPFGFD